MYGVLSRRGPAHPASSPNEQQEDNNFGSQTGLKPSRKEQAYLFLSHAFLSIKQYPYKQAFKVAPRVTYDGIKGAFKTSLFSVSFLLLQLKPELFPYPVIWNCFAATILSHSFFEFGVERINPSLKSKLVTAMSYSSVRVHKFLPVFLKMEKTTLVVDALFKGWQILLVCQVTLHLIKMGYLELKAAMRLEKARQLYTDPSSPNYNEKDLPYSLTDFIHGVTVVALGIYFLYSIYTHLLAVYENSILLGNLPEVDLGVYLKNDALHLFSTPKKCQNTVFIDGSSQLLDDVVDGFQTRLFSACQTLAYKPKTPTDFIYALQNATKVFQNKIENLVIFGHAAPCVQAIGDFELWGGDEVSNTFPRNRGYNVLAAIREEVDQLGQIFLLGCSTAGEWDKSCEGARNIDIISKAMPTGRVFGVDLAVYEFATDFYLNEANKLRATAKGFFTMHDLNFNGFEFVSPLKNFIREYINGTEVIAS